MSLILSTLLLRPSLVKMSYCLVDDVIALRLTKTSIISFPVQLPQYPFYARHPDILISWHAFLDLYRHILHHFRIYLAF